MRKVPCAGRPWRSFLVIERTELGRPLLGGHRSRFLEPPPDERPRGLVVEQKRALLADQERRGRDARQQVAGEYQLERLLRAHPLNSNGACADVVTYRGFM